MQVPARGLRVPVWALAAAGLAACGTASDLDGSSPGSTAGGTLSLGGAPLTGGRAATGGTLSFGGTSTVSRGGAPPCPSAATCDCYASGKTAGSGPIAGYRDASKLDVRITLGPAGLSVVPKFLEVGFPLSGGIAFSRAVALDTLTTSRLLLLESIDTGSTVPMDSCYAMAWDPESRTLRWVVPLSLIRNEPALYVLRLDASGDETTMVEDVVDLPAFCGQGVGCDLPPPDQNDAGIGGSNAGGAGGLGGTQSGGGGQGGAANSCAQPLSEGTLSGISLLPMITGVIELEPGVPYQLSYLQYRVMPIPTCTRWSMTPTAGATLDPASGLLTIDQGTPGGTVYTVTGNLENGRHVESVKVYVVTQSSHPVLGVWREAARYDCVTGAEIPADPDPIGEVWFVADGRVAVTWYPFETMVDYWANYTLDPSAGTIEMTFDHGALPQDADLSGSFQIDAAGDLVGTSGSEA